MKVKAQDSISARELWRDMLQFLRQANPWEKQACHIC